MPKISNPVRYNPAGEAARREQMRNADLDREERNKAFPTIFVKKYGFRPFYTGHDTIHIKGPLCPASLTKERLCLAPLTVENEQATHAHCEVCDKNYEMPHSSEQFKKIASYAYEGLLNSQAKPISLDVPYEAVKASEQDETRWVKVLWSQKDGRNQAVIYFIEKDANGDKTHIFADMDREEVRYDAGDVPPGKILAKLRAEFKNSESEVTYK